MQLQPNQIFPSWINKESYMQIRSLGLKCLLAVGCGLSGNMVFADSMTGPSTETNLTGSYLNTGFLSGLQHSEGFSDSSNSVVYGASSFGPASFFGHSAGILQVSAQTGRFFSSLGESTIFTSSNSGVTSSISTVTSSSYVTNNTDHGQYYTLNFHLAAPTLQVSPDFSPVGNNMATGSAAASVDASITTILDTVPCFSHACAYSPTTWSTHAELDGAVDLVGSQSYNLVSAGVFDVVRIDDYDANRRPGESPGSFASVSFNDYSSSLNLGYLAAGESRQVVYTLTASGTVGMGPGSTFGETLYTLASIEDPFRVGNNGPFSVTVTSAVPEPQTYAMLAAGLALLAVAVRRRRGMKV